MSLSNSTYSRGSEAWTLMARLPQLFQTCSWVPRKNPIAADLGYFRVIFFFILTMVYCVYLWKHTTYLHVKEKQKDIPKMPPELALLLAFISSNYSCLEHSFMVPMAFQLLVLLYLKMYLTNCGSPVKFSVLFVNVYSCQHRPSSVENLTTLGLGSLLETAASKPPWSPIE